MKIKRIVVKELFGIFDHDIPLNTNEHITIIHGPNGYGKTKLLTMVNAVFSSRYHDLRLVPFKDFSIYFDDRGKLCLKKKKGNDVDKRVKISNGGQLIFEFSKPSTKPKTFEIKTSITRGLPLPLSMIERMIPALKRIGTSTWLHVPTQEKLSYSDVVTNYGNRLPSSFLSPEGKNGPVWLKKIRDSIDIHFIETQRLLSISAEGRMSEYEEHSQMVLTVLNYSEELAEAIQSKLAEYGSLSQSLDRDFPTRLFKEKRAKEPTIEELKTKLKELEEKRSSLISAGFLDKEKEIDFKELRKIDDTNINVLSIYIEDVKKKLSVFDDLTARIDLLLQIINSRFLHKQLSINKKDGFVFTTSEGKKLRPTSLSSGEQHELVILYEMLFKVGPDSLILIDEPELSLHVAWQQQFLEDLEKVTKLVGFDVLIATHSPQIINDRWDLTVELEGPKQ